MSNANFSHQLLNTMREIVRLYDSIKDMEVAGGEESTFRSYVSDLKEHIFKLSPLSILAGRQDPAFEEVTPLFQQISERVTAVLIGALAMSEKDVKISASFVTLGLGQYIPFLRLLGSGSI